MAKPAAGRSRRAPIGARDRGGSGRAARAEISGGGAARSGAARGRPAPGRAPPRRRARPRLRGTARAAQGSRGTSSATEYDLAPGVLCPNGTLEAIARAQPEIRTSSRRSRSCGAGSSGARRRTAAGRDRSRPLGRAESRSVRHGALQVAMALVGYCSARLRIPGTPAPAGPSSPASSRDPRPAPPPRRHPFQVRRPRPSRPR